MVKQISKLCVSTALIYLIATIVRWPDFIQNLRAIHIGLFLLAVVISFVDTAIRALRWQWLLQVKGFQTSFRECFSFILVGMFFGMFIPTNLGGDIAKTVDFARHSSRTADTVSSVFMERWSGILMLSVICLVAALAGPHPLSGQVYAFVVSVFIALIAFSCLVFSRRVYLSVRNLLPARGKFLTACRDRLGRLVSAIQEYPKHRRLIVNTLVLACLVNLLRISVNFVNAQAAGVDIPFSYFFVFIPVIILIMMVPISVAGIGVREGAYLYFFSQAGMTPASAVLIAWMGFVLVIFQAILGGIIFAIRRQGGDSP